MNTPTVSNRANFEAVRSGHRTFQEASPGENMANGTSLHPSTGSSGSTLGTERTTGGNQSPDRLLTPDDVASLLGVPRSWVYERTRQRSVTRLPGIRLGKWRFWRSDVLAWLDRQR